MNKTNSIPRTDSERRLLETYERETSGFLVRLRAAGRSLEEAEDILHDVWTEALERLDFIATVRNLPAWINTLLTRRLIDLWRHERATYRAGERKVSEDILGEIIAGAGYDPLDAFVRDSLAEALHEGIRALPKGQREVVEAQVFQGLTFREISERTGVGMDTLSARKRYALKNLAKVLRCWMED